MSPENHESFFQLAVFVGSATILNYSLTELQILLCGTFFFFFFKETQLR